MKSDLNTMHTTIDDKFVLPVECTTYEERVNTFKVRNRWSLNDPTRAKCTSDELAMAGFRWYQIPGEYPTAKCFMCDIVLNLNDLAPEDDPWLLHTEKNPHCSYIKLGKRTHPRDYKYEEILKIIIQKHQEAFAQEYVKYEQAVKADILKLVELEKMMKADRDSGAVIKQVTKPQ